LDLVAAVQGYLYGDLDRSGGKQGCLVERIERGELGMKTGRGLYDWSDRDAAEVRARRDKEFLRRLETEA
jgi:3-hydroxybutyryl-CoA dehydrogenase